MNKAVIKEFAVNARRKLMESIRQKAYQLGITENIDSNNNAVGGRVAGGIIINGVVHDETVMHQRQVLVDKVRESGFEAVVEETAYTWFNRFAAIRFMEVNRYFDHNLMLVSSLNPLSSAKIAVNYFNSKQANTLRNEKIAELVSNNQDEELLKVFIVAQCNVLNGIMPFLFEKINDYTELLFPPGLLGQDSVLRQMSEMIPEDDWREVEIIGWLYQYYISERKDQVVGMNKSIIAKADIPAATQLFTPDWIVKYMVQNSLGRLWYEMYPSSHLVREWEFFIKPADEDFEPREKKNIEEVKFFDPCCGSGHILVYAFDMFHRMYEELGFLKDDIPGLILKNNLFGLDICKRAAQLASFALIMKSRAHTTAVSDLSMNCQEITEVNLLSDEAVEMICKNPAEKNEIEELRICFGDGKNFGSLIVPPVMDYVKYMGRCEELKGSPSVFAGEVQSKIMPLLKQGMMLSKKYDVVVTNPPYLNNYNPKLKSFVEKHYKNYKADLFSAFIFRCNEMIDTEGFCGMMTPMPWMFIKTHEKVREYLLSNRNITVLVKPEYQAFFSSACVPIMSFVTKNEINKNEGIYIGLDDFYGEDLQAQKLLEAIQDPSVTYRYTVKSKEFKRIPGCPIAYWASDRMRQIFSEGKMLGEIAEPKVGLQTGDNDRFLRLWYEVAIGNIGFGMENREAAQESGLKWFPYNKGGDFRKWYGNNEYLVNWEKDGAEIRNNCDEKGKQRSRPQNVEYYFRPSITWSFISSSSFGVRYSPQGSIFDVIGSSVFVNSNILFFTSFLCSKLTNEFLMILNPTMAFQIGNVATLPVVFPKEDGIKNRIDALAEENISISKTDWDSFETSWDFQEHPFIKFKTGSGKIEDSFNAWEQFTGEQFRQLKSNEEELNKIFIEIYGLQDEMTPDVEDKDVTIRKADLVRDVKSFISYAVGVMMGRYSLDEPGLIYAGGEFEPDRYKKFPADDDAIIPILEDEWFGDDVVSMFGKFVKAVFGDEYHQENMQFIAKALGGKEHDLPDKVIRGYFLKDFFKDHTKTYKKRPIYWLFTSGRNKSFNALVYMHRYDGTTLARLRKDYLHELQTKLEREIERLEDANEKKKLSMLYKHKEELRGYDEILRHHADRKIGIDPDDGVVVNYAKFEGLVEKIK